MFYGEKATCISLLCIFAYLNFGFFNESLNWKMPKLFRSLYVCYEALLARISCTSFCEDLCRTALQSSAEELVACGLN